MEYTGVVYLSFECKDDVSFEGKAIKSGAYFCYDAGKPQEDTFDSQRKTGLREPLRTQDGDLVT